MGEKSAPYLHLVRQTPSSDSDQSHDQSQQGEQDEPSSQQGASDDQPSSEQPSSAPAALNQPLQQAIMYAAVSWVALCVERSVYAVDIQPIARNVYEVSVHYSDVEAGQGEKGEKQEAAGQSSEGIILRVRLAVERGLALETTVEPVHP